MSSSLPGRTFFIEDVKEGVTNRFQYLDPVNE